MFWAYSYFIYLPRIEIFEITKITVEKCEYLHLGRTKLLGIFQQCNKEKRHHITPVCFSMNPTTHLFSINKPHELSCRFGTPGCAIHTNSIPDLVTGATARDPRSFLRQSCNKTTPSSNDKYSVNSHVIFESKNMEISAETPVSNRPLRTT
jgi:hypothetical protein